MKTYIHEIADRMKIKYIEKQYDVLVVGGGMSGVCAAIAAAREGAETAIVQERSIFGGNASSEIRMHIKGASCHGSKPNAAETGILMELQLHNQYLNENHNYSIWDGVLWSTVKETEHLEAYLNTVMYDVVSDGKNIQYVDCYQSTTENHFRMRAQVYIDATGNGSLGYFAGAEYRFGSESADVYGEESAGNACTGDTMGNTILFCARDTGHLVKFKKPEWAYTFSEEDLQFRHHGNTVVYLDADRVVEPAPGDSHEEYKGLLKERYDCQSGYWWIELGGDWDNIIKQAEDIRYETYRCVYGVWDHIKNGGDHGAENYELIWVGNQTGIREGRRLEGMTTLTEKDIRSNRRTEEDVAYGGWPMDGHEAAGLRAKGKLPSHVYNFDGLYGIPYGCYCSKNIQNLMMVGRIIGASKVAMSSARIMGTCAVGGQAVGTAAAMAVRYGYTPGMLGKKKIWELRQILLKNDCYIYGAKNEDPADKARYANVRASSCRLQAEPENVINGIARNEECKENLWCSEGIAKGGELLELFWDKKIEVSQIRLTFDPNLSAEHCISISKATIDKVAKGAPAELVKVYEIRIYQDEKLKAVHTVKNNFQRLNIWNLQEPVWADTVEILIQKTHGDPDARIFEVRVY